VAIGYGTVSMGFAGVYFLTAYDDIEKGDTMAIINFSLFALTCVMIYWSHWKAMTT
jgi:hypothetical protein